MHRMPIRQHTSPIFARALVELAEAADAPEPIYAPLRDALDEDDDAWVATELEEKFWQEAASDAELRDLAAYAPPLAPKGAFGAVELAAMSAPDVRTALRTVAATSDILHGAPIFDLAEREDGTAALVYRSPHDRSTQEGALAAEVALASAVELVRRATGEPDACPEGVLLVGQTHGRVRSISKALGCRVHTHAALDRVEMGRELLDTPLRTPDPRTHRLAMRLITLERRRAGIEWTAAAARGAARGAVTSGGSATLELARALGVTPHALRSRLASASVRTRVLVDDARRSAADRLLLAGARPQEIQRALGYADLASLRRACRRWWGMGPLARRTLLARDRGRRRIPE